MTDNTLSDGDTSSPTTISIVTATYNASRHLRRLIASLREQTDKDFQWVVADGASTDGTLELIRAASDLNVVISSQPDSGIYDALNRAIGHCSGAYYIVCGADDFLHRDAIAHYRAAIRQSQADIIAANYIYRSREVTPKNGPPWVFGQSAYIAGHAVATAFRRDLHQRFGEYTNRFPIGADQFFVLSACRGGASLYKAGFVAGEMGAGGVSSIDRMAVATEFFRIQLAVGSSFVPQSLLLALRVLRIMLRKRSRLEATDN